MTQLTLALLSFFYIGLLPIIFFKRGGTLNLRWFLTAWPYGAYPVVLVLQHAGYLTPQIILPEWANVVAVVLYTASIALISLTIGVHRVPLSLWHQEADAPQSIVQHGPYAVVRHPFYTSFLMALTGGLIQFPHMVSLGITLYAVTALALTAVREEKRLSASAYGPQYQDYIRRTGRFLPRLS